MDLYKLEWMKLRVSTYLWAIAGMVSCLVAMGILFLFILRMDGGGAPEDIELFGTWSGLLALMAALGFACFSIFAAAFGAKVIVGEYCGQNAAVLLTYPVRRKRLLKAKCRLVCGVTMISAFFGNILVVAMMYATAHLFRIEPRMDAERFVLTVLVSGLLTGILSSAAGMLSAVVGWWKRSGIAAIVCSLVIVCALANVIVISPGNLNLVMCGLGAVLAGAAGVACQVLAGGIDTMEV